MRNRIITMVIVIAAVLASSPSSALAQGARPNTPAVPSVPPPPGWGNCPRCQNNADRAKASVDYKVDGHAFNPKDLSGVWGYAGVANAFDEKTMPPLTELGKQQLEATFGEKAPDGTPLRTKDTTGEGAGKISCDPLGWPRLHTSNYGWEFVMLPDRMLQIFETNHTWRTIWIDGRKLPENPPEPRWLGWNAGHWEGDTFVVESNGYDDRSWIAESNPDGGWTHSDEMRVVERYRRTSYGTLEVEITVIDPKTYTKPWVSSKATIKLVPGTELWEHFCVPSDYANFNESVYLPAAGVKKK